MRSEIHKTGPQSVLARNLTAAFKVRGLSARGVSQGIQKAQGLKMSNRTVQNMLNGTGNPQLEGLTAVARYIHVPLWQLLCPGMEISHFPEQTVHELLDNFASLSELGRRGALRHLKGQAALERAEKNGPPPSISSENDL